MNFFMAYRVKKLDFTRMKRHAPEFKRKIFRESVLPFPHQRESHFAKLDTDLVRPPRHGINFDNAIMVLNLDYIIACEGKFCMEILMKFLFFKIADGTF